MLYFQWNNSSFFNSSNSQLRILVRLQGISLEVAQYVQGTGGGQPTATADQRLPPAIEETQTENDNRNWILFLYIPPNIKNSIPVFYNSKKAKVLYGCNVGYNFLFYTKKLSTQDKFPDILIKVWILRLILWFFFTPLHHRLIIYNIYAPCKQKYYKPERSVFVFWKQKEAHNCNHFFQYRIVYLLITALYAARFDKVI